ncbi:DUF3703 domain-containing protein [Altibacter sp. HG106]|jgi:hypothetical protein|uniref:DUF3703 domain-containing protein n=1 Tax=Altibacter sp. HG106 TaxID=3023937 RepID=UPI0023508008|nr:DUF3703 domain-containing protein [Altibacter sp. HG106]MDC7994102.1 DUF3703 domain-containing protein [Altibacter sp. HG106]
MKFNTIMPKGLKEHYDNELRFYHLSLLNGNLSQAWHHLERSHIIGQSYPFEHTYSHWLMLKFGFRKKNVKEVLGQVVRLLVGGWKSFIDHVPTGNTGGSDVPPLKKMELPQDLSLILNQYKPI